MSSKIGVLLLNLGTPAAPTTKAVRRYLAEFLSDKYVVDLPVLARYALLYGVILPFRPQRSAKAYQAVWTEAGSPLLIYSQQQKQRLQAVLGDEYCVSLGMRYGDPSIKHGVQTLQAAGCEQVLLLPLFPQYAESSTRTAIELAQKLCREYMPQTAVSTVKSYYDHPHYIEALAATLREPFADSNAEHLVMSFHSLPVRHLDKTEDNTQVGCDRQSPCPAIGIHNSDCYRAQCYATARLVASELKLTDEQYTVSFQSKIGRTPWVGPETLQTIDDCYQKAYESIAVACPGFTSDCLETLEEINMGAREHWEKLGGGSFHYLPCINDAPSWIAALAQIVRERMAEPLVV